MKHEAGKRRDSHNDAARDSLKQRWPDSTSTGTMPRPFRAVLTMHNRAQGCDFQPDVLLTHFTDCSVGPEVVMARAIPLESILFNFKQGETRG